jgi:predicted transporter
VTVLTAFFAAGLDAFFGAARFALFATFAVLLGFLDGRAFFLAVLLFAAVRFDFATTRFFPLPFFFAMVSLLLGVVRLLAVRVAPKKSAVICA